MPQKKTGRLPLSPRILAFSTAFVFLAILLLQCSGNFFDPSPAKGNNPANTIPVNGAIQRSNAITITLTSPANTTYASGTGIPLTVRFNATVDESWYKIDAGSSVFFTTNTTLVPTPDGGHQIVVYCNDSIGQVSQSAPVAFTIDTTPPQITVNSPGNTTYQSGDFTQYPVGRYLANDTFDGYAQDEMPNRCSLYYPNTSWQVETAFAGHQNVLRFWSNSTLDPLAGMNYIFRNVSG